MSRRNHQFFPQLIPLAKALDRHISAEPTTDRGATGRAVRDAEDAQARRDKQAAKLARRAAAAKKGGHG